MVRSYVTNPWDKKDTDQSSPIYSLPLTLIWFWIFSRLLAPESSNERFPTSPFRSIVDKGEVTIQFSFFLATSDVSNPKESFSDVFLMAYWIRLTSSSFGCVSPLHHLTISGRSSSKGEGESQYTFARKRVSRRQLARTRSYWVCLIYVLFISEVDLVPVTCTCVSRPTHPHELIINQYFTFCYALETGLFPKYRSLWQMPVGMWANRMRPRWGLTFPSPYPFMSLERT